MTAQLPPLPCPPRANPYEVLGRAPVYDSPWLRLREDTFRHRSGAQGSYGVVGFKHTACGVLALDDADRVILVGQWRYPLERYSWEIVEGGGKEGETPLEAIQRELAEEAGLRASLWEPLGGFHPSNASTDEETFLFLAQGLQPVPGGRTPDDDEELAVHAEPFAQCLTRILTGELTDSLTVVALLTLQARRGGVQGHLPPAAAERFFQRPAAHPSPGRARWGKLEVL